MRKRNDFRKRKTNSLSRFHLFVGFAQLLSSQKPSSFRFTLNTFGLPSESVLYAAPSISPPAQMPIGKGATLYFIREQDSASVAYQVNFFLRQNANHSAESLNRPRSQFTLAGKVSKSLNHSMQPIQINNTKKLRRIKVLKNQNIKVSKINFPKFQNF